MSLFVGLVVIAFCVVACVQTTERVCARYPALDQRKGVIYLSLMAWIGNVAHRAFIWLPNSRGISFDGHIHERIARSITQQILDGRFDYMEFQFLSNHGYRSFLGVFYALTGAPVEAVYFVHAAMAFAGLLFTLEAIVERTQIRSVPIWLVGLALLLPSAHVFAPWNMKEAPVLWGIGLLLRHASQMDKTFQRTSALTWGLAGGVVVALMRPQVALVWGLAFAVGQFAGKGNYARKLSVLLASGVVFLFFLFAAEKLLPGIAGRVQNDGLVGTLSDMTNLADSYGGSAIYRQSVPIPVVSGLIFTLFEPNPMYWGNASFAVLGMEAWFVTAMLVALWRREVGRTELFFSPFAITCLFFILGFAFYLGYMYNMGLMVRQRLQLMPVLISFVALPLSNVRKARQLPGS